MAYQMSPSPTAPIVVLGRSGQVASALQLLAPQWLPQRPLVALGRPELDLASPFFAERFAAVLMQYQPALAINAAAYTAVDRAECEPELAQRVNAEAVGAMARLCGSQGIPLLHLSTDYVFDGSGESPWRPDDRTAPLGVYGASKLDGERQIAAAVLHQGTRALVLRVSWVFGQQGINFVRTILGLAEERNELKVVADQLSGPTSAESIAWALLQLAEKAIANRSPLAGKNMPFPWGTYHFQGQPVVSWYEFAKIIMAEAHMLKIIKQKPQVIPIPSTGFSTLADRPANSRLDCQSTIKQLGLELPQWQDDLTKCLLSWY